MTSLFRTTLVLCFTILPLEAQTISPLPISPISPPQASYAQLQAYLNLSDAQVQSLITIQNNRNAAHQAIYKQISDKQTQLSTLLRNGTTDALTVGQLEIDINNLQRQLSSPSTSYQTQALAVLTADQKNKLPGLVSALQLQTTAWQAVTLELIDAPAPVPVPLPIGLPVTGISPNSGGN